MTELKTCPFCGGDAYGPIKKEYGDSNPIYGYVIECSDCTCDIEEDTAEDAIAVWNRRPTNRVKIYPVSAKDAGG